MYWLNLARFELLKEINQTWYPDPTALPLLRTILLGDLFVNPDKRTFAFVVLRCGPSPDMCHQAVSTQDMSH